jgi:heme A synthase
MRGFYGRAPDAAGGSLALVSTSGGRDDLGRFRRLTAVTAIATFVLIVIGGVVRVSDSGLGCGPAGSGTEGWPLCDGELVPFVGGSTLIEFTHRLVAGIVAVLILLLAWRAWRTMREQPWLVRGSILSVVLVLAQAALGGLTVEHNLHAVLVAIHLGMAMVLLAVLLGMYRAAAAKPEPEPAAATPGLRIAAAVAALLLLATIVAGGYVAGTEGEGTAVEPVAGAHLACGQEFPGCGDSVLPFGRDSMLDAQLTHRVLMLAATIAVLALVALALRRGIRGWPIMAAAGLVLLQVLLGALNVWLGKHAGLIVGHLTLGTLLWTTVIWAGLTFVEVPARAGATARATKAGAEGATA